MEQTKVFKQLQIMHLALVGGVVILSAVIGLLLSNKGAAADYSGIFQGFLLAASGILALQLVVSYLVWNKRQSGIPASAGSTEKMAHYQTSCILRWALIESGTLISVILTFLEQNLAGLAIAAVGLAFLFLAKPNKDYVMEKYGLRA